jgi:hypothetical protein
MLALQWSFPLPSLIHRVSWLVPDCWFSARSRKYMLLFLVVYLIVIPYLVDTAFTAGSDSKGSHHLRIRRMGLVACHPCLRLWDVHRGHQDRVP